MSDAILWLEKGEERWALRERVTAGAWRDSGGRRVRPMPGSIAVYAESWPGGSWGACAGRVGWDARGDAPSGPAGMAAADAWLTEHAPWVTLEGGAYVVPPEPVDAWDGALAPERAAVPPSARRDAAGAMAHAVLGQADRMRLDDVVKRVEALEAARGSRVRVEAVEEFGVARVRVTMLDDSVLWVEFNGGLTADVTRAMSITGGARGDAAARVVEEWRRRLGVAP